MEADVESLVHRSTCVDAVCGVCASLPRAPLLSLLFLPVADEFRLFCVFSTAPRRAPSFIQSARQKGEH
jgi:hypothetical protein